MAFRSESNNSTTDDLMAKIAILEMIQRNSEAQIADLEAFFMINVHLEQLKANLESNSAGEIVATLKELYDSIAHISTLSIRDRVFSGCASIEKRLISACPSLDFTIMAIPGDQPGDQPGDDIVLIKGPIKNLAIMATPGDAQSGEDIESYTAIKAQLDQIKAMFANLKTWTAKINDTLQTLTAMVDKAPEAIERIANPALRDTLEGMLTDLVAM